MYRVLLNRTAYTINRDKEARRFKENMNYKQL